jgi:hypothetical protein
MPPTAPPKCLQVQPHAAPHENTCWWLFFATAAVLYGSCPPQPGTAHALIAPCAHLREGVTSAMAGRGLAMRATVAALTPATSCCATGLCWFWALWGQQERVGPGREMGSAGLRACAPRSCATKRTTCCPPPEPSPNTGTAGLLPSAADFSIDQVHAAVSNYGTCCSSASPIAVQGSSAAPCKNLQHLNALT